jgi:hypothetical protein
MNDLAENVLVFTVRTPSQTNNNLSNGDTRALASAIDDEVKTSTK